MDRPVHVAEQRFRGQHPGGERGAGAFFALALTTALARHSGPGYAAILAAAASGPAASSSGNRHPEQGPVPWRPRAGHALARFWSPAMSALAALRGAHGDLQGNSAGIVVISGTGSIALWQDSAGRNTACGGWGWLLIAPLACESGATLSLSTGMADGRPRRIPLAAGDLAGLSPSQPLPRTSGRRWTNFGAQAFARLAPDGGRSGRQGETPNPCRARPSALGLRAGAAVVARAAWPWSGRRSWSTRGALKRILPAFAAAYRAALGHVLPGMPAA